MYANLAKTGNNTYVLVLTNVDRLYLGPPLEFQEKIELINKTSNFIHDISCIDVNLLICSI